MPSLTAEVGPELVKANCEQFIKSSVLRHLQMLLMSYIKVTISEHLMKLETLWLG